MPTHIILEFPSDLPEEGFNDPEVKAKGKQAIIMELLRKNVISQGWAAELLEIDCNALFDLMGEYRGVLKIGRIEEVFSPWSWRVFVPYPLTRCRSIWLAALEPVIFWHPLFDQEDVPWPSTMICPIPAPRAS